MRTVLIIILLFLSKAMNAQTPHRIKFNYDSAGNQTQRYICMNCLTAKTADNPIVEEENIMSKEEIEQENLTSEVKYFPNPVLEELNVNWTNTSQIKLQSLEVYSLSGQLLSTYKVNVNQESLTIPFSDKADGYYNVILNFTDGNPKTIKIVKVKN